MTVSAVSINSLFTLSNVGKIMILEKKYTLNSGTQVRSEDFGLLFYTMIGPRLYFLPVKQWIRPSFFQGQYSLRQWMTKESINQKIASCHIERIQACLEELSEKGVIREC